MGDEILIFLHVNNRSISLFQLEGVDFNYKFDVLLKLMNLRKNFRNFKTSIFEYVKFFLEYSIKLYNGLINT